MRTASDLLVELASQAPANYPALHVALQLLVLCVAPKADHLLRHLPPTATLQLARGVDQLLLEATQQLFSFELDAARAALIQRRVSDGGLGLRRRGGPFASAAWLASWAQCYQGVCLGPA